MKLLPESVWLALDPVDMRTGVDGLSLHVQQALGRAPCDGTAYVFSNRRRTRLKVVSWDGTGVWMCLRRLHRGQFVWPEPGDKCWQLSAEQWQWLVMGVDLQTLRWPDSALKVGRLDAYRQWVEDLGFIAHIRARDEEALELNKDAGFRARRWVVERTHS